MFLPPMHCTVDTIPTSPTDTANGTLYWTNSSFKFCFSSSLSSIKARFFSQLPILNSKSSKLPLSTYCIHSNLENPTDSTFLLLWPFLLFSTFFYIKCLLTSSQGLYTFRISSMLFAEWSFKVTGLHMPFHHSSTEWPFTAFGDHVRSWN